MKAKVRKIGERWMVFSEFERRPYNSWGECVDFALSLCGEGW